MLHKSDSGIWTPDPFISSPSSVVDVDLSWVIIIL